MKYIIISFNSRTNLMSFAKILRNSQIPMNIINTPHKISSSCSLSIKADILFQPKILTLLSFSNVEGLLGVYSVQELGIYNQITKIK